MATEWYYRKGDRKCGPIDDLQLKALADSGEITIDDLVMRGGHGQWVKASLVKGLFPDLSAGGGSQPPRASAPSPKQGDEGLVTLTVEQAKAISKRDTLRLDQLTTLSGDVARALAAHKGLLSLDGLSSLSDEAIKALIEHRGPLSLNGLTSLSDEAAQLLAGFPYSLHLNGVSTLSDVAANALAAHPDRLWLEGLTTLSASAAASLQKHYSLHWPDRFWKPAKPANQAFLESARSRSCYPVLRLVHGVLTVLGVIGCVVSVLMSLALKEPVFAILAIALIIVLLIQYGFFRMIVDAVDVLIEIGRHTTAGKSDDTPSG